MWTSLLGTIDSVKLVRSIIFCGRTTTFGPLLAALVSILHTTSNRSIPTGSQLTADVERTLYASIYYIKTTTIILLCKYNNTNGK